MYLLPLLFADKAEFTPYKYRKDVEWEAYRAIKDFEPKAKRAVKEFNEAHGSFLMLDFSSGNMIWELTSPATAAREAVKEFNEAHGCALTIGREQEASLSDTSSPADPAAVKKLVAKLKEMALEVVDPFLRSGSLYALDKVPGVLDLELLRAVEDHYKDCDFYTYFLGKSLFKSNDMKLKSEGQKKLERLAKQGNVRAMIFVGFSDTGGHFDEALIKSCKDHCEMRVREKELESLL